MPREVAVNGDKVLLKRAGFPRGSTDKAGLAQDPRWQVPQTESAVITANTSLAELHRGTESTEKMQVANGGERPLIDTH